MPIFQGLHLCTVGGIGILAGMTFLLRNPVGEGRVIHIFAEMVAVASLGLVGETRHVF